MYGQLLKDGIKMANKYEQLADILREKIRLGTYQEGDAITSLTFITPMQGVSFLVLWKML